MFDQETNDLSLHRTMNLHHRTVSPEQMQRFENSLAEILTAFGLDVHTPATEETPRRFLQALFDATEGYEGDPKLFTMFETECGSESGSLLSQVVEGPIPFVAICEHHALPFYGQAYVGYVAHEHIIGLSKLTRLVWLFARRFTVQERLGQQIADLLAAALLPHGIAVYLQAHHLCTQMRGVRESSTLTRTNVFRGSYENNPALRTEFFTMCGIPQ